MAISGDGGGDPGAPRVKSVDIFPNDPGSAEDQAAGRARSIWWKFRRSAKTFIGWGGSSQRESIEQFYATLNATYAAVQPGTDASADDKRIGARIEALITVAPDKQDWRAAYLAEQLMVNLLKGDMLRTELVRRTEEAVKLKLDFAATYDAAVKAEKFDQPAATQQEGSEARARALLARLTNDLQWLYTKRFTKRKLAYDAMSRVRGVVFIAFVTFGLVLYLFTVPAPVAPPGTAAPAASTTTQ